MDWQKRSCLDNGRRKRKRAKTAERERTEFVCESVIQRIGLSGTLSDGVAKKLDRRIKELAGRNW